MSLYSANFTNNSDYHDAINYKSTFYSQFEREALRRYVSIENYSIVFKEPPENSKKTLFDRWLKETKILERPLNYKFQNIETRLSNKKLEHRKNADLREFLYFKDYYMTKKFFTFGFQTVPENMYHIISTTVKPLDLYLANQKLALPNGFFDGKNEYLFTKQTLDAYRTYLLYPGYQYVLVTSSKCIFHYSRIQQKELLVKEDFASLTNTSVSNEVQEVKDDNEIILPDLETLTPQYESLTPEYETLTPLL